MDRDSRKAVVGILAGSGDDCELSSSVDQIHSGNLVVFVPFRNAMPVDPKIPEAQGFCGCHRILDNLGPRRCRRWLLGLAAPHIAERDELLRQGR